MSHFAVQVSESLLVQYKHLKYLQVVKNLQIAEFADVFNRVGRCIVAWLMVIYRETLTWTMI